MPDRSREHRFRCRAHLLDGGDMLRRLTGAAACAIGILICSGAPISARGGYAGHQAWADYHITGLPPEIRASVLRHRNACGAPLAATHAFAVPSRSFEPPFLALHYESLWCPNRTPVCRGENCLHEVYARSGGRYRLLFRDYVQDIRITTGDGPPRLVVLSAGNAQARVFRWNGRKFSPAP